MICDSCALHPYERDLPYGWCCPDSVDYCVDYIPADGSATPAEIEFLSRLVARFSLEGGEDMVDD